MKTAKLKWNELDRLLLKMGFEAMVEKGRCRVYQRPGDKFRLILPDRPPTEAVTPFHIVSVRGQLDDFGIMRREDFDALIAKRSRARVTA